MACGGFVTAVRYKSELNILDRIGDENAKWRGHKFGLRKA
jgi:hypothetical protein